MDRGGGNAFVVGDVMGRLERATRELGKSIDPMRGALDYDRLTRVREGLNGVLADLDALIAARR